MGSKAAIRRKCQMATAGTVRRAKKGSIMRYESDGSVYQVQILFYDRCGDAYEAFYDTHTDMWTVVSLQTNDVITRSVGVRDVAGPSVKPTMQ
jgi:hypothetical protein